LRHLYGQFCPVSFLWSYSSLDAMNQTASPARLSPNIQADVLPDHCVPSPFRINMASAAPLLGDRTALAMELSAQDCAGPVIPSLRLATIARRLRNIFVKPLPASRCGCVITTITLLAGAACMAQYGKTPPPLSDLVQSSIKSTRTATALQFVFAWGRPRTPKKAQPKRLYPPPSIQHLLETKYLPDIATITMVRDIAINLLLNDVTMTIIILGNETNTKVLSIFAACWPGPRSRPSL
jgi:hypothetical protein